MQSAEQGCFSFCLLVFVSECFLIFYHAKEFLRDQCAGQQPAATDNTYTGCGPINTNKYTACHVPGDTRRGRDKRGIYSSDDGELRTGGLAWHCQHTSVQFLEKVQIAAQPLLLALATTTRLFCIIIFCKSHCLRYWSVIILTIGWKLTIISTSLLWNKTNEFD